MKKKLLQWFNWLTRILPGLWLAWFILRPEVEAVKEIWGVARGITAEMFMQAAAVGVAILVVVHLATKRYPALNGTAYPVIERLATRAAPHVSYVFHLAWPPISRFFRWIGRGLLFVGRQIGRGFVFVWRQIGRFFSFVGRVLASMVPESVKRWFRRRGESLDNRYYVTHDKGYHDEPDSPHVRRINRIVEKISSGSLFIGAFYATVFLGLNETMNDPKQQLWELTLKVGILVLVLLTTMQTYRTVLAVLLLEGFLFWVSATHGVQVGTVYMLLFGLAYLLWLAYARFILNPHASQGDEDDDDEEADDAEDESDEEDSDEPGDDEPDDEDPPKKEG